MKYNTEQVQSVENFSAIGVESPFMSRFADWDDPKSTYVLLMIIFGFTSFILLVDMMPLVAVMVFGLGLLGIFVWGAVNYFDAFDDEEEATRSLLIQPTASR